MPNVRTWGQDVHDTATPVIDCTSKPDGSRTPTTTQRNLSIDAETVNLNRNSSLNIRSASIDGDANSIIAPSTYAASTINGYAPSSIAEHRPLLTNSRDPSSRNPLLPVQTHSKKTKGRKAFVGICDAINFVIPIDINDEATSMSESSLGKMGKAVQEMRERRRTSSIVRRNTTDDGGRSRDVRVQS